MLRDVVDNVPRAIQCFHALNRIKTTELEWSPRILYRCWQLLSMPNFFSSSREKMKMYELTLRSIETLLPLNSMSRDIMEVRVRMLLCADLVRDVVIDDDDDDDDDEDPKFKGKRNIIHHIEICNDALERIQKKQDEGEKGNGDDITRLSKSELKRCSERMILFTFFGRAQSGHVKPVRLMEDLKRTLNSLPTTWYVLEHLAVSMKDVKYNHIRQYLLHEAVKNLCNDDDDKSDDHEQRKQTTMERLLVRLLDSSTSESVLNAYHTIATNMGFVQDAPFDSCDPCFKNFSVCFCEYIASEAFNDTIEPLSKRYQSSDVKSIREYLVFFLKVCESLKSSF